LAPDESVDSDSGRNEPLAQGRQFALGQAHRRRAFGAGDGVKAPGQFEAVASDCSTLATLAHELGDAAVRVHEQRKAALLLLLV